MMSPEGTGAALRLPRLEQHATFPGAFDSPPRTVVGDGAAAGIGGIVLAEFAGVAAVVLVSDGFLLRSDILDPVRESLAGTGLPVVALAVDGEPTEASVDGAVASIPAGSVLVGVGGGSVLDTAKLLALLVAAPAGTSLRDVLGAVPPTAPVAPLILAPTTTGAGAEVTRIAMVTVDEAKAAVAGRQLIPRIVVLDPDLVASLPGSLVASTGMDAIAHAVESALSRGRTAPSLHASFSALEILLDAVPAGARDEADRGARAAAQWGAHLAGLSLNAGVVLGHSIAYGIAHFTGLPHGTTSGMSLVACLAYNDPELGDWADEADRRVAAGLARVLTRGASESLRDAGVAVTALMSSLGLPVALRDAGITREQAADIADRCVALHPRPLNPRPFSAPDLRRLLDAAWSGDLATSREGR